MLASKGEVAHAKWMMQMSNLLCEKSVVMTAGQRLTFNGNILTIFRSALCSAGLADEGLKGYKRWRVPLLTKAHVRKRRAWAEAHAEWGAEKWDTVLYSDESKFNFFGSDGVQWCRRGPGEALDVHNVLPRLKHGGGGVMVWGCMMRLGFGRLILVEGTMNAVQYCRILN